MANYSHQTGDATVLTGAGHFVGAHMIATGASASVIIYDNTAASGNVIAKLATATDGNADDYCPCEPIPVYTGIHVDVTNAEVSIAYKG